jgi:hypothetical protein
MPLPQRMNYREAIRTRNYYRCNVCWGELQIESNITNPEEVSVVCKRTECSGTSFVSKNYVDRRILQDHFDYLEAFINLGEILGLRKSKTVEESIAQLGF